MRDAASMVDFTKKVRKNAAETLEPGEQVHAAAVITPRGQVLRGALAGGVGGVVGLGVAAAVDSLAKTKAGVITPESGTWADQFPKKKVFLSVTDRRVVVHKFSELTGKPKELLGWVPREAVHGLEVEKGRITHAGVLHFTDGSSYAVDLLKGSSAEEMVQALGGVVR